MKRTTIRLPDDLAAALEREARRRHLPISEIAREAIAHRLGRNVGGRRELPFVAIGDSGQGNVARNIDELLKAEWIYERLIHGEEPAAASDHRHSRD
jgi:hypothetical protein